MPTARIRMRSDVTRSLVLFLLLCLFLAVGLRPGVSAGPARSSAGWLWFSGYVLPRNVRGPRSRRA